MSGLKRSGGLSPADLDLVLYADVWHQGPQAGPPEGRYARYRLDAAGIAARITTFLREHAR